MPKSRTHEGRKKKKETPYRNYLGTADGEKVHSELYF